MPDDTPRPAPAPAWRLGVRLTLGFGVLMALMATVVLLAGARLQQAQRHAEQVAEVELPRMLSVQELARHAQGHGAAMARLLTAPREERETIYPALDAEYAAIDRLQQELAPQLVDLRSQAVLARLEVARVRYREVFAEVGAWIEGGDPAGAAQLFAAQGQPALRQLIESAQDLHALQREALTARQHSVSAGIARAEWQLALLAGVALLLSALLSWRITRSIALPMRQMEHTARALAAGDTSARVQLAASREIERVAEALNTMAAAVAQREAEIERIAFSDRLTGLPNRSALRRWAAAAAPAERFALVLDLARLATVNEVLGFDAGDTLLVTVARRLEQALAAAGGVERRLARVSGGVFVVVGAGSGRPAVEALRSALVAVAARPAPCQGHEVDVQFVCGMADGEVAGDIDPLLRRAEQAAAEAKQLRETCRWHRSADAELRSRQLGLLSSLQTAAAQGELELWLQPQQDLQGPLAGRTSGFEGLVRWRHPQRGFVTPAEFVPFAERAGHVQIITRAMLDAALAALARWPVVDGVPLVIAVNVSTADLLDDGFVDAVLALARRHAAPLERLRLEITESRLMHDADRALPVMRALREQGVQWAIDDFGTGYSSLAYLQRLPVSELKIDRSFVAEADRSAERQALLRTIIELAHGLCLRATAEGVERPEELELLRALGCDQAQGYLIARPMPLAQALGRAEGASPALAGATPSAACSP